MPNEKLRGEIRRVGTVEPAPPNPQSHKWQIADWVIEGGDYPGVITGMPPFFCGWGLAELALISELAAHTSEVEAIEFAGRFRDFPVHVPTEWPNDELFTNLWMEPQAGEGNES